MRLFIGIALAPEAVDALAKVRSQFEAGAGQVRWSAPNARHITLQFLGQVSEEGTVCVVEKLRGVRATHVPVRMEGLGFFQRAGIFWAGVALTPELLALQQFVTAAMRNCGFSPEERAYHPHITLARAKGRNNVRALAPLQKAVEGAKLEIETEFTAEEFLLYESLPGPEGSRYEVRARFPLVTDL
jgi:RNA 2',3'-cyclic 3'-phosphodiesterase